MKIEPLDGDGERRRAEVRRLCNPDQGQTHRLVRSLMFKLNTPFKGSVREK